MLLNKRFEMFIAERPICVMARAILERVFDPDRLDALFDSTAEVGYTRQVHFATVVNLMADVVFGVRPSVHAAFQALDQRPDGVSITSIYNKLDRIETCVSAALVQDAFVQCAAVVDALNARLPSWLPGFRCRVLDGNHLAATEHRLDPLRTIGDAPLPGKAIVVIDPERMLVENVFLTEDGHAQERSLLKEVLPHVAPKDVWIGDRNFCTLSFLFGIMQRRGYFVIRQHGLLKGQLQGTRRRVGRCPSGVVFEQAILVTDPKTGQEKKLRRITIELNKPTRDGDREVHVLTNLPTRVASATRVAELYSRRWTIETLFQEVTTTLQCEIRALAYPKAALFAFSLALVAYNAVSLIKAALRAVHGAERVAGEVSGYYLALELRGTYDGMMVAIPERHWAVFRAMPLHEFVEVLKEIATHARLQRYRKHPRGPKKPPPTRKKTRKSAHASTFKFLNGAK